MQSVFFDSILCPTDFSACSGNALRWAIWLASSHKKPLRLLHSVHLDMPAYVTPDIRNQIQEQWERVRSDAEQNLKTWAAPHLPEGLEVRYEISDAPPVEAVVASAHRDNAWVVMGTHGRTGWRQVWMGSVTTRTIELAKVPVLAIPPDRQLC